MATKVLKRPKYLFTFENNKHLSSPVGSGIVTLYKTEKDPKTGLFKTIKCGTTNRQAEMDLDAKGVNLKDMLAQCEQGKLKKAPLIYGDTTKIPDNKFDARKNAFAVANLWDNSPLLRTMYGTKEDYKKDLVAGVDIEKKLRDYQSKVNQVTEKALARYKLDKEHGRVLSNDNLKEKEKETPTNKEVK